jgi:hypothetical protein
VTWVSTTANGFRWQSLVDFVVLSRFIYLLLRWSRDARALRVTLGILGLEAGALIARQLDLAITVRVHDIVLGVARSLPRGIAVDGIPPERITVRTDEARKPSAVGAVDRGDANETP